VDLPADSIAELYYDHGRSLAAIAREYLRAGDSSLVAAIEAGADWALPKPVDSNVNYVSALIEGLAYAYLATGTQSYLDRAVYLEENGVFPQRQSDGAYCHDGHNELVRYHCFILEGHMALRRALPAGHALIPALDDHIETSRAYLQIRTAYDNALVDTEGYCIAVKTYTEMADLAGWRAIPGLSTSEMGSFERCIDKVIACRDAIQNTADKYVREKYFWHCCQIGVAVARYLYE
jgi:hypothetical protein